jgi:hypothetical protein
MCSCCVAENRKPMPQVSKPRQKLSDTTQLPGGSKPCATGRLDEVLSGGDKRREDEECYIADLHRL